MTHSSKAAWQTADPTPLDQKVIRMAQGGLLGRPTATFAGGVSPTTGGGSHGVVGTDDLKVTGTTLTLTVATGGVFINGTSSIDQGPYYGYVSVAESVVLNAHDSQPRIDLVIAQVLDDLEDSSGSDLFQITKVTGTPSGSPVVPTVPAGSLVLAQVAVPATSGAVTVTDKRRYAAALGGLIRCKSTERPSGAALWEGQWIYELDTKRVWLYNGTSWIPVLGRWGCEVGMTAAVSYGSGVSTVTFDSETYDTDGYHANPGANIVIPSGLGGVYSVGLHGIVSSTPPGNTATGITYNGTLIWQNPAPAGSSNFPSIGFSRALAAGDVLTAQYLNASGSVTVQMGLTVVRVCD